MATSSRVKDLREQGDKLFERGSLMSLWQTMGEQFYPERADFTRSFTPGEEFGIGLMTGVPVLARRDLANNVNAMLRPRSKLWYHARTLNEKVNEDPQALKWLDWASEQMQRVMYDPLAQFVRSANEGDHDFVTFGQCVLQETTNRLKNGVLFQAWHIRDVAWCENVNRVIDVVHRNWCPTVRDLNKLFPDKVDAKVKKALAKEPYKEIKCRHIILPAEDYDYIDPEKKPRRKFPFVSLYIDCDNDTLLEEVPAASLGYIIPRWKTITGSQYAHSPATMASISDARLLQQISLTLIESAQKAVDPPMVGVAEAIQGGVNLYAGGQTWIDSEYDERTGEVLRKAYGDGTFRELNWGIDREERIQKLIHEAFYLNQLNLPEIGKDMTAYETQKRVEEYVRRALPLLEPIETEYNGGVLNEHFDLCMRMGVFGPRDDVPQILKGQDIRFVFDSPLQSATERNKADAYVASLNLLSATQPFDPNAAFNLKINDAFRDALRGVGAQADWIADEDEAAQARQGAEAAQRMKTITDMVSHGANVAEQVGTAAQSLNAGGLM